MSSTQPSLLSVNCKDLDLIEQTDRLANLWIENKRMNQKMDNNVELAFNKSKNFIENGQRLENMSWRLWRYQRQPTNQIDNSAIKRLITSVLLSPATVHDADSHAVAQEKCHDDEGNKELSNSIIFINHSHSSPDTLAPNDTGEEKEEVQGKRGYEDDEEEDEEDYYLSDDDLYDDEDLSDININFVKDFQKTQPRPTTPRRSLLSDLFSRVSSPPSLLSNSTSSFTSTNTHQSSMENSFQKTPPSVLKENDLTPNEAKWRESFHGW